MTVVSGEYSSIEQTLKLATDHISWSSLYLEQYTNDLFEKVERFRLLSADVRQISNIIEQIIVDVLDQRLLRSEILKRSRHKSMGKGFFIDLRRSSDTFFAEVRQMIADLPDNLLQVETLVCNTQTGTAAELHNYYDYWRQTIHGKILSWVYNQLDDLFSVLQQGPCCFGVQVSLNNQEIVIDPSLEFISESVLAVVNHWIKQSAVLPQWSRGSCILESEQQSQSVRFSNDPKLWSMVDGIELEVAGLLGKMTLEIDKWSVCKVLWNTDKRLECLQLYETRPCLVQYDQQLQHYRKYWNEQLECLESCVTISCVT